MDERMIDQAQIHRYAYWMGPPSKPPDSPPLLPRTLQGKAVGACQMGSINRLTYIGCHRHSLMLVSQLCALPEPDSRGWHVSMAILILQYLVHTA